MTITLFDTLTRARRRLPEGPVKLYVCGVTPYDTTHLGHAFTFVQFDTFVRFLRWTGRQVTYVQNVTDVDDSILQRARQLGVDWRALGEEQTARYLADMRALNVADPTHYVRATDSIPHMQAMIERLVGCGAAYAVEGGSVFFRVASAPTYGELSRLDRARMLEIASQQDDADVDDPRKDDPLDFALWKGWSGREDEPRWPSPWGYGRPGWHIECSAMIDQYLGPHITIHGGGADLVFPHHESEIVQSERATGVRPLADIWMHSAMVWMDGAKMSKSLGNMVFAGDLLRAYSGDAVRLYLLSHHYRQELTWDPAGLEAAAELASRLAAAADGPERGDGEVRAAFSAALGDDFDAPKAIKVLERASGPAVRELAGVLGLRLR